MERALLKPTSPEAKSVNHSTAATCALEGRVEARSYTQIKFGGGGFHGPTSAAVKSSKTQGILNIYK